MPLIYKPYQATLANKEGQKLYYPRLVKFGKMVNTQKMAELIAEKASLTAGDVHNVIRNLMSVSGEVIEANAELDDKPELVNEDVYGNGWLIKISVSDPSELDELMSAAEYEQMIAK